MGTSQFLATFGSERMNRRTLARTGPRPARTTDNSPAFQRWVRAGNAQVPQGRQKPWPQFCRPCGTRFLRIAHPAVKLLGYYRIVPAGLSRLPRLTLALK